VFLCLSANGSACRLELLVFGGPKAGLHAFTIALRHQLSKVGIRVFEVVLPAVDTELNPEGRARRGNFRASVTPAEFVQAVMKQLETDTLEMGYGFTAGMRNASRAELDRSFEQMNSRW
jgi:uncharacterized oxidoreductase